MNIEMRSSKKLGFKSHNVLPLMSGAVGRRVQISLPPRVSIGNVSVPAGARGVGQT